MLPFRYYFFQKNLRYSLDVFHAERFACKSEFLFIGSGVEFVSNADQWKKPRIDYYFKPNENIPTTTIIGEIMIADVFSTGKLNKYSSITHIQCLPKKKTEPKRKYFRHFRFMINSFAVYLNTFDYLSKTVKGFSKYFFGS